ncbi:MAG: AI-2E family transporter [Candidatus Sulfotelmatobacter sp.]
MNASVATDVKSTIEPAVPSEEAAEETEVLRVFIKAGTAAQFVVAAIAFLGLVYVLKLVLVTTLAALLLAYTLEPLVSSMHRLRVPRWLGALIAVILALVVTAGIAYFSYNRAVEFADQLPGYSAKIRESLGGLWSRTEQIERNAQSMVEPPKSGPPPVPVTVQQPQGVTRMISENSGTILDVLLAVGFVPFLVYFMLAFKDHSHLAVVHLFPQQHRLLAHRTVGNISHMIRTYIAANVVLGVLSAILFTVIFWLVGIKYYYFVGAMSGFLSLIPYLGVFIALLPPLAGGVDSLTRTGLLTVLISVVGLHVIMMNVVYPKVIGERLQLNPLAVSLSLLFWSWIWGAAGLLLAIPLLGASKIVCDRVEPLGGLAAWLGSE